MEEQAELIKAVPWSFERDKSVLLVIDMQNDFLLPGGVLEIPQARSLIPKVKQLIQCCRELNVPVVYTMHNHNPYINLNVLETKMLPVLIESGLRRGSEGAKIYDEIAPLPGDVIIEKKRFSAFYNTELELVLRNIKGEQRVDTIIISGVATNICCESTARDAFFRDYKVVFGSNLNATFNEEDHLATLRNMENIFGRVMSFEEIMTSLKYVSSRVD